MQGATIIALHDFFVCIVSIHAPYAGSDCLPDGAGGGISGVSIHAPYAGSDSSSGTSSDLITSVSIHAPYAGSDISRFDT